MQPKITVDLSGFLRGIENLKTNQLPYATSTAINRTLNDAKAAVVAELGQALDRPTPWLFGGVRLQFSTKSSLKGAITLGANKRAGAVVHHAVPAGTRPAKGLELALRGMGLLPSGAFAVPTQAAPLDQFGNVPRSFVKQVLTALQTGGGAAAAKGQRVRKKLGRAGIAFFVGKPNSNAPLGIWERRQFASGTSLRPVFVFVQSARYPTRLGFTQTVERVVEARFAEHFRAAFADAVKTAR
jgi:hypothetical protein